MSEAPPVLQSERWQEFRRSLALTDTSSTEFARPGLASRVQEPSVRLLIQPEAQAEPHLEFDQEFWDWFIATLKEPFLDGTDGHRDYQPTAQAAVAFSTGSKGQWEDYAALYRNRTLEVELGQGATFVFRDSRGFRLTYTVGDMWRYLRLYSAIVSKFSLKGPFEITVALRNTKGVVLANFATGWAEPYSELNEVRLCDETHLLLVRTLVQWPDEDEARALSFSIGSWIEDAWGYRNRRYIARQGPLSGQFDTARYRGYG